MTNYAISKNALDGLTRQWATELAKAHHLTVNSVCVGATMTEASQADNDPMRAKAREQIIEKTTADSRLGQIDDIAQIVVWLASEGSRWVNGQVINGSGGVSFL